MRFKAGATVLDIIQPKRTNKLQEILLNLNTKNTNKGIRSKADIRQTKRTN